ncbi:MAG: hypothetical protein V3V08_03055 [Nannocystaceae bacterium]
MSGPRLGIILDDTSALRMARPSDPVAVVALRSCLLNPPRAKGARTLSERIRTLHAGAEICPYAWHFLTHTRTDGLAARASRNLGSEFAPASAGHLRENAATQQAWSVTRNYLSELRASALILSMPPSFSPSVHHRRLLTDFVRKHRHTCGRIVCDLHGLWSVPQAADLASDLEVELMLGVGELAALPSTSKQPLWIRVDAADHVAREELARVEDLPSAPYVLFTGPAPYSLLRAFAARTE